MLQVHKKNFPQMQCSDEVNTYYNNSHTIKSTDREKRRSLTCKIQAHKGPIKTAGITPISAPETFNHSTLLHSIEIFIITTVYHSIVHMLT
jgi:hypothetical protein